MNAENGEYVRNDSLINSANDSGAICEGAIAGILWDIFDNIDDDYNHDGVGDIMDNGLDDMLDVMVSYRPDHIEQFWDFWINNGYDRHQDMWSVWFEHGEYFKDSVPPTGKITANYGSPFTSSLIIDLTLDFEDTLSGMIPPGAIMHFSNSANGPWTDWEDYSTTKSAWNLSQYGGSPNYGIKMIYVEVTDAARNPFKDSTQIEYVIEYPECIPGDANANGSVDVGDAKYIINCVYVSGSPSPDPYPICSGDANGDCACNIADAVYIINFIFKEGLAPVTVDGWIAGCGLPLRK